MKCKNSLIDQKITIFRLNQKSLNHFLVFLGFILDESYG